MPIGPEASVWTVVDKKKEDRVRFQRVGKDCPFLAATKRFV